MQNQIATIVESFAKANKVSREKLTNFANEVIATVPQVQPQVVAANTTDRVVKTRSRNKRADAHQTIMDFARKNGGVFTRAQVESLGIKSVAFACDTMVDSGLATRLETVTKVAAGRGRGSVTYKLNAPAMF